MKQAICKNCGKVIIRSAHNNGAWIHYEGMNKRCHIPPVAEPIDGTEKELENAN